MNTEKSDFVHFIKEVTQIRSKYGIPKGIIFLPDRLNISLKRVDSNFFEIDYSEYFSYVPSELMDVLSPITTSTLQLWGLPLESLEILENGFNIKIEGSFDVLRFPVLEILMLSSMMMENLDKELNVLRMLVETWTNTAELKREYNNAIEKDFVEVMTKLQKVFEEHPSFVEEQKEVYAKYGMDIPENL